MMEILYKGLICVYDVAPNISPLGGMIATFVGNREVGICDDKKIPVGFFSRNAEGDPWETQIDRTPKVNILMGSSEFRTDIYEESDYNINDFVYCSENGKITNENRYWGNIIIGIVNYLSPPFVGIVTCFAKNLEFTPSGKVAPNLLSRYDLLRKANSK